MWKSTRLPLPLGVPAACLGGERRERQGERRDKQREGRERQAEEGEEEQGRLRRPEG